MVFRLLLIAVFANTIPNYDVPRICRSDTQLGQDRASYNGCVQDETTAKERLAKDWSTYPALAKEECVPDAVLGSGLGESYVELMTCLEMQDWKKHLGSIGGQVGGGAVGGSPPTPTQIGGGVATHPLGGRPTIHVP